MCVFQPAIAYTQPLSFSIHPLRLFLSFLGWLLLRLFYILFNGAFKEFLRSVFQSAITYSPPPPFILLPFAFFCRLLINVVLIPVSFNDVQRSYFDMYFQPSDHLYSCTLPVSLPLLFLAHLIPFYFNDVARIILTLTYYQDKDPLLPLGQDYQPF